MRGRPLTGHQGIVKSRRNPFCSFGLSNRHMRLQLHRAVDVRIIGLKTHDSYVVRFADDFCKTRQTGNQIRKMPTLMGRQARKLCRT